MASVILVTGANRGLGFELVRSLLRLGGYHVCAAAREWHSGAGSAQDHLSAAFTESHRVPTRRDGSLSFFTLDVTEPASIHALADAVARALPSSARVNCVVNNAGVYRDGWTPEVFKSSMQCNVAGAIHVTSTLLPLMAPNAHVVNVSSGLGSRANVTREWSSALASASSCDALLEGLKFSETDGMAVESMPCYKLSKAALNAATILQSKLYAPAVRVNCVDPGWCRTDMCVQRLPVGEGCVSIEVVACRGGSTAPRSAADGAQSIFNLICGDAAVIGTGHFYSSRGKVMAL